MINMTRGGVGGLALAAAATLIACGGEAPSSPATKADPQVETTREPANQAPVIESVVLSPWEVRPGDVVHATVATHDPEYDDIKLGYVWHIGQHRFPGGESSIEIPLTAKRDDIVRVSVTASDSISTSRPMEATIEVENSAPTWREITIERDARVVSGSKLTVHAIADDHDGDELKIVTRWFVNKRRAQPSGAVFDTSGLRRGDIVNALLLATDGDLESPEHVTEHIVIENSDPSFVSAPGSLAQDGQFKYEPKLEDADGDRRFRFSLAKAPSDMTIDASFGEVNWTATESHQGSHMIEIVARDLHGGEARQQFDLTVKLSDEKALPASRDSSGTTEDDE